MRMTAFIMYTISIINVELQLRYNRKDRLEIFSTHAIHNQLIIIVFSMKIMLL